MSANNWVLIDGSEGEGGGQVLRSSLTLSLVTGKPVKIEKIRAKRKKPGLLRQHLTAVQAAAAIGNAQVEGAQLGSREISFTPGQLKSGQYEFSIGTAGSTTLVLQTILPALATLTEPSTICLEGGTHNPMAPPFDFLVDCYLPLLEKMGPKVHLFLERPGFYPAGGGRFQATIEPQTKFSELHLHERGKLIEKKATACVAKLPRSIADRELHTVKRNLTWGRDALNVKEYEDSLSPGNYLTITLRHENIAEQVISFGERQKPSEAVAKTAIRSIRKYLKTTAPVGEYLADQLLVPMAIAGGGSMTTMQPSSHTLTNIEVIKKFFDLEFKVIELGKNEWRIEVCRKENER